MRHSKDWNRKKRPFSNHHQNHQQDQQRQQEEEEYVDDLAFVAANYATAAIVHQNHNNLITTATTTSIHKSKIPNGHDAWMEGTQPVQNDNDEISCHFEKEDSDESDENESIEVDDDDDGNKENGDVSDDDDDDEEDYNFVSTKNNKGNQNRNRNRTKNDDDDDDDELESCYGPKTRNELDLFTCPIPELEKQLDFHLQVMVVKEESNMKEKVQGQEDVLIVHDISKGQCNIENSNFISSSSLVLAGYIKNHLITERTIVVESTSRFQDKNPSATLLDEGTLLLLQLSDEEMAFMIDHEDKKTRSNNRNNNHTMKTQENIDTLTHDHSNHLTNGNQVSTLSPPPPSSSSYFESRKIIPIGKILEVFGPVSHPLYAIRLVSPPTPKNSSHLQNSQTTIHTNKNNCIMERNETNKVSEKENIALSHESIDVRDKEDTTITSTIKCDTAEINDVICNTEHDTVQKNDDLNRLNDRVTSHSGNSDRIESLDIQHECSETETNLSKADEPFLASDPWSESGFLTLLIKSKPKMEVFFSTDQAKIVDTKIVAQNSRKGCDASNMYDEEVVNINEMDFSDDEAEKLAKLRVRHRKDMNNTDLKSMETIESCHNPHSQRKTVRMNANISVPSRNMKKESHPTQYMPHIANVHLQSPPYQPTTSPWNQHPYASVTPYVPQAPPPYYSAYPNYPPPPQHTPPMGYFPPAPLSQAYQSFGYFAPPPPPQTRATVGPPPQSAPLFPQYGVNAVQQVATLHPYQYYVNHPLSLPQPSGPPQSSATSYISPPANANQSESIQNQSQTKQIGDTVYYNY